VVPHDATLVQTFRCLNYKHFKAWTDTRKNELFVRLCPVKEQDNDNRKRVICQVL
jgi:hypothetical protein